MHSPSRSRPSMDGQPPVILRWSTDGPLDGVRWRWRSYAFPSCRWHIRRHSAILVLFVGGPRCRRASIQLYRYNQKNACNGLQYNTVASLKTCFPHAVAEPILWLYSDPFVTRSDSCRQVAPYNTVASLKTCFQPCVSTRPMAVFGGAFASISVPLTAVFVGRNHSCERT